jgi:hypothetical protein
VAGVMNARKGADMGELTAAIAVINTTISNATAFATAVIDSQAPAVKQQIWERHMTLTEPFYLIAAKLAAKMDAQLGGEPPKA